MMADNGARTGRAWGIVLLVQTLAAGLGLWYTQFPDNVLCSPADDNSGFILLFPDCPEPRPFEGLVVLGCLGVALTGAVPAIRVLKRGWTLGDYVVTTLVCLPFAAIGGAFLALHPAALVVLACVAPLGIAALLGEVGASDCSGPAQSA